jgi:hypothetical protein
MIKLTLIVLVLSAIYLITAPAEQLATGLYMIGIGVIMMLITILRDICKDREEKDREEVDK